MEILAGVASSIVGSFVAAFALIAKSWDMLLNGMGSAFQAITGKSLGVSDFSGKIGKLADGLSKEAKDSINEGGERIKAAGRAVADAVAESIKPIGKTADDLDSGSDAADRFADALEGVEDGAGGNGRGAAGAITKIKESLDVVSSGFDTFKSSVASAFEGLITGASSFKDALGSVLKSLANVFSQAASSALFGPNFLGGIIPGFANGTNNAPGGMALVGERGPELVNLPRGAQVRTASDTARRMGGGRQQVDIRLHVPEGFTAEQMSQVQGVAVNVTSQGLSSYDRTTLPGSVNRINSDPRRRG